ncbi:MAG: twin-arginine translocase TatA/TatE family subunit [Actinobacteria bacterium]|nr:twin-arginine translocase TatA/TatE family subunit [Actinomycetota bacterium]
MAGLGAPELIIVLVIVLVVFGGAKLPKLARSLGEAQKEFKKGSEEGMSGKDSSDAPAEGDQGTKGPIS